MFLPVSNKSQKAVYIASDHAGFDLKNFLVNELRSRGYTIDDLGPQTYNPTDDYPAYTKKVTEALSRAQDESVGILICRNGVGVSVLANKFKNIRCALSWSPEHAKSARNDDNVNVLALPADYISKESALQMSLTFLETLFSNKERHVRRLNEYGDTGSL